MIGLHHRLAAQEILPLDVALVHGFRLARDGEGKRDIPDGHAVGVLEFIILEFYDIDSGGAHGGDTGEFEIPCKSAHGRYAAVSATNPDDHSRRPFFRRSPSGARDHRRTVRHLDLRISTLTDGMFLANQACISS